MSNIRIIWHMLVHAQKSIVLYLYNVIWSNANSDAYHPLWRIQYQGHILDFINKDSILLIFNQTYPVNFLNT